MNLLDVAALAMNPLDLLISPAYAQAAADAPVAPGALTTLFIPMILVAIMYLILVRPQMKRAKEQRAMLDKLGNGDEIITNGGIAGVVREIGDHFVSVEIADNVRVRIQKGAIGTVLPKGTLKSL